MKAILRSAHGLAWLAQFSRTDQATAIALVDKVRFIDETEFAQSIKTYLTDLLQQEPAFFPLALYVEREIPKLNGVPKRLFAEPRRKRRRRITGSAEPWIYRTVNKSGEVGSEGVLRTLVTELQRSNPSQYISHGGPDVLRTKKPNTFVVLTDFLGSGQRVSDFLTSVWKLRTFRSWYSGKQIRFMVVAYAGTKEAKEKVQRHPSAPEVRLIRGCKTLSAIRPPGERAKLIDLCQSYHVQSYKGHGALGYKQSGALMVFAHGCPNNAPSILHAKMKGWTPLFPGRSTAGVVEISSGEGGAVLAMKMLQKRDVRAAMERPNAPHIKSEAVKILMEVLSAVTHGSRSELAVSARCDLTILETRVVVSKLRTLGWVNDNGRPTTEGIRQRDMYKKYLENQSDKKPSAPPTDDEIYYVPESLRRPRQV
ncbi:hypothetical protein QZM66_27875 [Burkholderia contaminans]|uniref:phosphoribosyltransferase-like protein n=2 Tax=Burkholderiaceae TaxID=119060 RepID=UPI00264D80D9|nr:hypothetical protein [Burkholderia contaminans]MDN7791393.1 hypothetical protein [Burkholderia contaminans]